MGRSIWRRTAMCLGVLTATQAWAATPQAERIARIEQDLQPSIQIIGRQVKPRSVAAELAARNTPAVSIAVVDHGRISWAKAYGLADVASGAKATVATMFEAGSVSKPVGASGAMQLMQAHLFALDDAANGRLTSWRIPDNDLTTGHPVTIRQLWTHTAGVTAHGLPGYAVGAPVPSLVDILDGKWPANTPAIVVQHVPGTVWRYSSGGIAIAQLVMTDTTHTPFPPLMRRLVFTPLGMADSTYEQPPPTARDGQLATGYLGDGEATEGRFHLYPEMAAAGLWSTPTDLAKWSIALVRAYNDEPSPLMSHASAVTMLTPGLGAWGIGIHVVGSGDDLRFTHEGDDWGFKADFVIWPKGERAIIAMANSDQGMEVVTELMQAVAREYGWRGLEARTVEPVALAPARQAEIVGSYGKGLARITADGGVLHMTYRGSRLEIVPIGADRFAIDDGGDMVPFGLSRTADGKIAAILTLGLFLTRDP
jgi:CubicO group peptidase (beta-lactamase class C family)